jgi:hypothetical protein
VCRSVLKDQRSPNSKKIFEQHDIGGGNTEPAFHLTHAVSANATPPVVPCCATEEAARRSMGCKRWAAKGWLVSGVGVPRQKLKKKN